MNSSRFLTNLSSLFVVSLPFVGCQSETQLETSNNKVSPTGTTIAKLNVGPAGLSAEPLQPATGDAAAGEKSGEKIWGKKSEKSGDRHKRDFPEQHSVGFSRLPWPSVRRSGHVNASEVQPIIESQARQLVISLPRCKGNRTDRIIG